MTDNNDGTIDIESLENDISPDDEVLALRKKVKSLHSYIKKQRESHGELQTYFSDIVEAIEISDELVIKPQKKVYKKTTKKKIVESPVTCAVMWSDWHMGGTQNEEEIEYINSFSPEILEHRICDVFNKDFLKWVEVNRSGYNIDDLTIFDLGDNISGDIHAELQITNAYPTPVQVVECAKLKAKAIAELAPHFKNINIHFITADNHSRLTKKPQSGQEGYNSHNYVLGHMLQCLVRNLKNVSINIYPSHKRIVEVANRRYLITHGHGVRGWAGFPWYGVDRMVGREAKARLNDPDFRKFHRILTGHWHVPIKTKWYLINGSASGTDSFDHKNGRRSEPYQCAFLIHPNRGEFNYIDFELDQ